MNGNHEPIDTYRKRLTRLRAQVRDGIPHIRMRLTTPLFNATKGQCREMSIRVYRRETPGFVFGEDYDEYFHGMRPEASEAIFAGTMPAINGRQFEYRDEQAEAGRTYAYWVSTDQGDTPIGPIAIKLRDPRVWWPYAVVRERMQALAARHPEMVSCQVYGHSVRGTEIAGITVGRGPRALALVGTLHAGESGPELIVPALERLADEQPELLAAARVAVLPSVNLDERESLVDGVPWYLRTNANGVDLNRNFDADWDEVDLMYGAMTDDPTSVTYRGARPASEPETQAVVHFVDEVQPEAVFSYHWLASLTWIGAMPAAAGLADPAYMERCLRVLTPYARGFLRDPTAKAVVSTIGACSGSLPAWAYRRHGIPGFDMEGNSRDADMLAATKDHTTPGLVADCSRRHHDGILATLKAMAGA